VSFNDTVSPRIAEQWEESLKLNAERINNKRQSRLPDADRFNERVVETSHKGYGDYVNPDFVSKAGLSKEHITAKHLKNLKTSFLKYQQKLDHTFATVDGVPAKRFKERLALTKGNYAAAVQERLIAFTGTKIEGLGPVSIAGMWLTNDLTVLGSLRGGDKIKEGAPFLVATPAQRGSFKVTLNQRLIQAGALIAKSGFQTGIIKQQNDQTNHLVQGFVDAKLKLVKFATEGDSHVDYLMGKDSQLYLELQVSQK
jgi:hypothetical protein